MSVMSVILRVCVAVLIVGLCVSCDRGVQFLPRASANFSWVDCGRPTALDTHVDAHSHDDRDKYWAMLRWKGSGQLGGEDRIVLLCLRRSVDGGVSSYQLEQGLVLSTWGLARDPDIKGKINRLRVLHANSFQGKVRSGKLLLTYDGQVTGKSNYDEGSDLNCLRFQVRPKENHDKLVSIVKDLYPLLEKEKDAQVITGCLTRLLDE